MPWKYVVAYFLKNAIKPISLIKLSMMLWCASGFDEEAMDAELKRNIYYSLVQKTPGPLPVSEVIIHTLVTDAL